MDEDNYKNATIADHGDHDINDDSNIKHIFHQTRGGHLSKDWLLLDNQSTLDQFVNKKYLTNVNTVQMPKTVSFNVGTPP